MFCVFQAPAVSRWRSGRAHRQHKDRPSTAPYLYTSIDHIPIMNITIIKFALIIGSLLSIRSLDLTTAEALANVRMVFFIATGLTWSLLGLLYLRIRSLKDSTPLFVSESDLDPNAHQASNPLAALLAPKQEEKKDEGRKVEITNYSYDMTKYKASVSSYLSGPIIGFLIHTYFGYAQPLVLQSVMNITNLMTSELARIYFIHDKSDDLVRPWKAAASPFAPAAAAQTKKEKKAESKKSK